MLKFNSCGAGRIDDYKACQSAQEHRPSGQAVAGKIIVGHSETGHHHVVDADCATLTRVDPFTAFCTVRKATRLTHHREYDTHPAIELQPGMYEFRTGREFDPLKPSGSAPIRRFSPGGIWNDLPRPSNRGRRTRRHRRHPPP